MTVGERIKKRREKLGISQSDLATKIGISKQNLYKYENNIITNIPSDRIEMIAKILEVSPPYLMGWEEEADTHYARLVELYFKGIMHWSEEMGISTSQTAAIRDHFSELLLRYKTLVEQYVYSNLNWKEEKDEYLKLYGRGENKRSPKEIEELYIRQNLEKYLESLGTWIPTFPHVVSGDGSETINFFSAKNSFSTEPKAAHNDHETEAGELDRMKKDIENLKRPKEDTE